LALSANTVLEVRTTGSDGLVGPSLSVVESAVAPPTQPPSRRRRIDLPAPDARLDVARLPRRLSALSGVGPLWARPFDAQRTATPRLVRSLGSAAGDTRRGPTLSPRPKRVAGKMVLRRKRLQIFGCVVGLVLVFVVDVGAARQLLAERLLNDQAVLKAVLFSPGQDVDVAGSRVGVDATFPRGVTFPRVGFRFSRPVASQRTASVRTPSQLAANDAEFLLADGADDEDAIRSGCSHKPILARTTGNVKGDA